MKILKYAFIPLSAFMLISDAHARGGSNTNTDQPSSNSQMQQQSPSADFSTLDTNRNGQISRSEFNAGGRLDANQFSQLDSDGNGSLSRAELEAYNRPNSGNTGNTGNRNSTQYQNDSGTTRGSTSGSTR